MKKFGKKLVATTVAATMALSFAACGGSGSGATTQAATQASGGGDTEAAAPAASGDAIEVGIINNDPNESGYRTANDKDLILFSIKLYRKIYTCLGIITLQESL